MSVKQLPNYMTLLIIILLVGISQIAFALPYKLQDPTRVTFKQNEQAYKLQTARRFLQQDNPNAAKTILNNVNEKHLTPMLKVDKALLEANLAVTLGHAKKALTTLGTIKNSRDLPHRQKVAYFELAGLAYRENADFYHAALAHMQLTNLADNSNLKYDYIEQTWGDIQQLTPEQVNTLSQHAKTSLVKGWLQLGKLISVYGLHSSVLSQALAEWQQRYPNHPANAVLPQQGYAHGHTVNSAENLALLLPLSGPLGASGNAIKDGFMAAFYQSNNKENPQLTINVYDTNKTSVETLYQHAVNDGATVIVGPLTKDNVTILAQSNELDVPTLALNYTPYTSDYLYQFALSPKNEAQLVAEKSIEEGQRHAIIIAPQTPWAQGIVEAYQQIFKEQTGKILENKTYNDNTNFTALVKNTLGIPYSEQRRKALERSLHQKVYSQPRRRQDVDTVFLVATPAMARRIRPLFKFYFAGDIPIYSTSMIYSGEEDALRDRDLEGIKFCAMPWVVNDTDTTIAKAKKEMEQLIPNPTATSIRLFAFGYDAYQLAANLPRLSRTSAGTIQGVTGTLYLSNQQRFYRQLLWAQFQNGIPKLSDG